MTDAPAEAPTQPSDPSADADPIDADPVVPVDQPGVLLRERARTVRLPSRSSEYDARRRLGDLVIPAAQLGEVADLAVWWSGVSSASPAPPPSSPHAMVLVADHGIAVRGVSAHPLGWTAMAAHRLGATGELGGAATQLGVTLDVVDVDVAGAQGPSTAPFDVGPAMTADQVESAYRRGMELAADRAGHDLLVLSLVGVGDTTTAAALAASALGIGFMPVIGRGSGIDDLAWMRKAGALRDGLRRSRLTGLTAGSPSLDHLIQLGSVDAAVAVAFLVEAASRRIPVILDGPLAAAAALLAQRVSPSSRHWWLAVDGVDDAVSARIWDEIAVARVWTSAAGSGVGGLLAVPILRTAAALLHAGGPAPETPADA